MKIKSYQIILTTLIVGLIACDQNAPKKKVDEIPENWKTLKEAKYTISYPDTFDLDMTGEAGKRFVLFSRFTSGDDFFRENINLTIQDLSGYNFNLDQYVEITEGQLDSVSSNGKLIESIRKKGNSGEEFHQSVYTGKQGNWILQWLQYYWVIDQKAYVLTLTCEINQYENYYPIGTQIMNTFRVK